MDTQDEIREHCVERSVAKLFQCQNGLPRVSRPQQQTVWPRTPLGGPSQNHVLGGVLLHHGQTEESGERIQGAAQVRPDGVSQSIRRILCLEPSGDAAARLPKKWLPPLPPLP